MDTCNGNHSNYASYRFVQTVAQVLKKLQTKSSSHLPYRVYVYDLIEQYTTYSSCSIATLLGYPSHRIEAMTAEGLEHLIHPDDLDRVSEHFQRLTTLRAEDVITLQYRMRQANGTWCWLCSAETPFIEATDNFPLQVLGIVWLVSHPPLPVLNKPLSKSLAYSSPSQSSEKVGI